MGTKIAHIYKESKAKVSTENDHFGRTLPKNLIARIKQKSYGIDSHNRVFEQRMNHLYSIICSEITREQIVKNWYTHFVPSETKIFRFFHIYKDSYR